MASGQNICCGAYDEYDKRYCQQEIPPMHLSLQEKNRQATTFQEEGMASPVWAFLPAPAYHRLKSDRNLNGPMALHSGKVTSPALFMLVDTEPPHRCAGDF